MSLFRLIIWSSLIGGWSAFFGWFVAEIVFHNWIDNFIVGIVVATLVAIPIGGGICCASGLTNPRLDALAKRLALGCAGGLLGGLLGSLLGGCVFGIFQGVPFLGFLSRVIGWTLIGCGIGVTEGIFDRNIKKIRNGLLGGAVGGFLAGLFFLPINYVIGSAMSSRAFAFVILGLFIGLFIGLAQVILKEAWLTVEAGFRPGRQMILGQDIVTMGTAEKSSMIFIAYGAKGVEPTHLRISKEKGGGYLLEDNQSRTGTLLNGQPVSGAMPLKDGDAIQFGVNVVRFNDRVKPGDSTRLPPPVVKTTPPPSAPIPKPAAATKPPAPTSAIKAAPAKAPAPKPAVAAPKPSPAVPAKPQEGRCPICDKVIVGIPGERRCGKCFTSF